LKRALILPSERSCELSLALFDSQLDTLKLSILKQPATDTGKPIRKELVALYVQKYFELSAVFEEGASPGCFTDII
jgi:hypothetical protein